MLEGEARGDRQLCFVGLARDGLCLDAEAVSDILQCRISTWNHPNITVLNPGARWPAVESPGDICCVWQPEVEEA